MDGEKSFSVFFFRGGRNARRDSNGFESSSRLSLLSLGSDAAVKRRVHQFEFMRARNWDDVAGKAREKRESASALKE